MEDVNFSKVTGSASKNVLKVTLLLSCFSCFFKLEKWHQIAQSIALFPALSPFISSCLAVKKLNFKYLILFLHDKAASGGHSKFPFWLQLV